LNVPVRRLPLFLTPVLAALLGSGLIAHAGADAPRAFRTADAGAACRLAGPALVCSSLGSDGSVSLREDGRLRVVRTLPWWDASTPVVRRWTHDGISCRVLGNVILCRSGTAAVRVTGDGFAVTK
jgi:hypothetical protein